MLRLVLSVAPCAEHERSSCLTWTADCLSACVGRRLLFRRCRPLLILRASLRLLWMNGLMLRLVLVRPFLLDAQLLFVLDLLHCVVLFGLTWTWLAPFAATLLASLLL